MRVYRWLGLCLMASCFNAPGSPAASTQKATSSSLKIGSAVKDCANCPELIAVPEVGHSTDQPGHIFFVTKFEITWRQYSVSVIDGFCPPPKIPPSASGSRLPLQALAHIADDYPLTLVPVDEFRCYLLWLRSKTGHTYRFPSPSEWEHFARSGVRSRYPWGEEIGFDNAPILQKVPHDKPIRYYNLQRLQKQYHVSGMGSLPVSDPRKIYQSDDIWPVGSFKPNDWNIYDVIGNAEEVVDEASPKCGVRPSVLDQCKFLETRGISFLPPVKGREREFSLLTFKGYVHIQDQSGTVGYRLVRD